MVGLCSVSACTGHDWPDWWPWLVIWAGLVAGLASMGGQGQRTHPSPRTAREWSTEPWWNQSWKREREKEKGSFSSVSESYSHVLSTKHRQCTYFAGLYFYTHLMEVNVNYRYRYQWLWSQRNVHLPTCDTCLMFFSITAFISGSAEPPRIPGIIRRRVIVFRLHQWNFTGTAPAAGYR